MIQSESMDLGCVCPDCLYRCRACMGTNTVVPREALSRLVFTDRTGAQEAEEERDALPSPAPLRPEDFID